MRMSTPLERIQSGIAIQTSPSGSPEAKDSSATEAVRHERMARQMSVFPSPLRIRSPDAHLAPGSGPFERPFPSRAELW
jgi:hypothetical protein